VHTARASAATPSATAFAAVHIGGFFIGALSCDGVAARRAAPQGQSP